MKHNENDTGTSSEILWGYAMENNYMKSNMVQNVVQILYLHKIHRAENKDENAQQDDMRVTLNVMFSIRQINW